MQRNETLKSNPEQVEHENSDYLFSEIDDASFEETMSLAIAEIMEKNRSTNDDESIEKAVSTEDIASAKSRGLVPQSGNWEKPKRWVRPEDADVPVDGGKKPRRTADWGSLHNSIIGERMDKRAIKNSQTVAPSVFGEDFNIKDFQDIYSISLEDFTTSISSVGTFKTRYADISDKDAESRKTSKLGINVTVVIDSASDVEDGVAVNAGFMSRLFNRVDGELRVYHRSFMIKPDYRGQGIASDINEHVEEQYEKLGVHSIHLEANAEVGGYAWARQGYDFQDGSERGRIQTKFRAFVKAMNKNGKISDEDLEGFLTTIKSFNYSWEFASWNPLNEPHGKHLGKTILLGSTWKAKKILDKESSSYKRGKIYYALKRKENEQTS